ncbi:cilia- and flagella-associated protein 251-like [Chenopodium quinoa]|uniref:cilia- and flagella-associated protein 251-like n=1 Tax=Chenopodium quinoa TaxID=63459 RepID=UPI000B799384|nr:cilia- and flagella-associated protein 251-like [Chenopodium quinoa]XP_021717167.1 cilia- and flagella-associated protein 251-like [Chenopodium quinoa]
MFKQSPSRNNRSKGIKVKHILQICVLLAVCIWLIYQVKHSHEKRQEYEVKDDKDVVKVQSDGVIPRIGRRDIPRITEVDTNGEKHEEDEDEKDGEEEDNKHEEDESEIEDVKIVEREEERGGGDDEIDEHEPEKTETESEHEEEAEEEDKEREEKEDVTEENHTEDEENDDAHEVQPEKEDNEENSEKEVHIESEEHGDVGKEDHSEQEVTSDEQDHDVGRTNTREAQEMLYRADDASSEVAHNVQFVNSETENVTSGHGNEMWGKINFGQEHDNKTSDNAEELIKPEVQPRDFDTGTSNVTVTEPKNYKVNLTKPDASSLQNSTLPEITSNSTVAGGQHSAALLSNETQTTLDFNVSQNGTVELPGDKEPKLPGNVLEQDVKIKLATDDKSQQETSADGNKAEDVNTNNGESLSLHNSTFSTSHDTTNDKDTKEAAKNSSVDNENQGDKSDNSGEAASDEIAESHSDEVTGHIQHDPIDASDTTALVQEERESRTDLNTLPKIRNEIQNTEEVVSE